MAIDERTRLRIRQWFVGALDRVMEYVEAGAQGINVALRAPVDEDALSAYVEEVIPAVRAATS